MQVIVNFSYPAAVPASCVCGGSAVVSLGLAPLSGCMKPSERRAEQAQGKDGCTKGRGGARGKMVRWGNLNAGWSQGYF